MSFTEGVCLLESKRFSCFTPDPASQFAMGSDTGSRVDLCTNGKPAELLLLVQRDVEAT